MATQRQKDFVDDIESALKALQHQGIDRPKTSQLLEHAGTARASLDAMVYRMAENPEDAAYIERLKAVFSHVQKVPTCILELGGDGVVVDDLPKIQHIHPDDVTQVFCTANIDDENVKNIDFSIKSWSPYVPPTDSQEILNIVLTALKPLNREGKEDILASAGRFYRVGE